jgi:hypothetical protein
VGALLEKSRARSSESESIGVEGILILKCQTKAQIDRTRGKEETTRCRPVYGLHLPLLPYFVTYQSS